MMKSVHKIIASGFGSGFSPLAPGTAGSIMACVIIYFLQGVVTEFRSSYVVYNILYFSFIIFFTITGIISVNSLEKEWGNDDPKFTIDEIAGMFVAMFFIPVNFMTLFAGFILFRFFDILKPFGIRHLERVHGGRGVMFDDLLAGVYANVLLQVILFSYHYF